jgi:hypothetical protein
VQCPKPVRLVSSGLWDTLIVDCDSQLWGFGSNLRGTLGVEGSHLSSPVELPLKNVTFVTCGGFVSVAKNDQDCVYICGTEASLGVWAHQPLWQHSEIFSGYSYILLIDHGGRVTINGSVLVDETTIDPDAFSDINVGTLASSAVKSAKKL